MARKLTIKVHESEGTLLDSFETLATLCSLVGGELSFDKFLVKLDSYL